MSEVQKALKAKTVPMDPALHAQFKAQTAREGRTLQGVVGELVRDWLKERARAGQAA